MHIKFTYRGVGAVIHPDRSEERMWQIYPIQGAIITGVAEARGRRDSTLAAIFQAQAAIDEWVDGTKP